MFVAPRACFCSPLPILFFLFFAVRTPVPLAVGTRRTKYYGLCPDSEPRAPLQLPHWLTHTSPPALANTVTSCRGGRSGSTLSKWAKEKNATKSK
jgi:hypothetical protein